MSGRKVYVAVTNDLETDQRVHKVCLSLTKGGFEPVLVGILRPSSSKLNRPYQLQRMSMCFQRTFLFYAEYNLRLFLKLLFSDFEVVVANDTDTLLAAFLAAKIRHKKIVFDAHELFTEVPELVGRPFVKQVWQLIENSILPHIESAYTVCQPIADIYQKKNGLKMQVVRNAPLRSAMVKDPGEKIIFEGKKIILYQGAVNVGRGIEWIIDAMPYLENVVFLIAGDGDIVLEIQDRIQRKNLSDKVVLLGKVPFEELNKYTFSADLGVCLLENRGLNYFYSLPNRIFDFAHAGVPMLATDFPEIRNIVDTYNLGELIADYEPINLAKTIQNLLLKWETFPEKNSIFAKAQEELCWENEEKVLLEVFNLT